MSNFRESIVVCSPCSTETLCFCLEYLSCVPAAVLSSIYIPFLTNFEAQGCHLIATRLISALHKVRLQSPTLSEEAELHRDPYLSARMPCTLTKKM